jgi:hypothetical protein
MPTCAADKGVRITMKVRVDKRPYLAGFQTPPHNSNWENIHPDPDGMGETREFVMPSASGEAVTFNGEYDEQVPSNDPNPQATYTVTFTQPGGQVCGDRVVVPKGAGPVSREYVFNSR